MLRKGGTWTEEGVKSDAVGGGGTSALSQEAFQFDQDPMQLSANSQLSHTRYNDRPDAVLILDTVMVAGIQIAARMKLVGARLTVSAIYEVKGC